MCIYNSEHKLFVMFFFSFFSPLCKIQQMVNLLKKLHQIVRVNILISSLKYIFKKKYFLYTDFIKNLTQVHKSIIRGLVRESIEETDMKNETNEESKN